MNDSIWAIVAGFAKAYALTFDDVLYNVSYANVILYGAVLPSYNSRKKEDSRKGIDKDGKPHKVVKADDPRNAEKIRKYLEQCE